QEELLDLANKTGRKIDQRTYTEDGSPEGEAGLDMFLLARHAQEANERLRRINAKRFLLEMSKEVDSDLRKRIERGMKRIRQMKRENDLNPFEVSQEYVTFLEAILPALPEETQTIWTDF